MGNRLPENWWNGVWPAVGIAGLASLSVWFVAGGWVNDDFVHIDRLSRASVWFLVFMLPVFPIPGRSELYLYLPGAGWCLLAGHLVDRWISTIDPRPQLIAGLFALYVTAQLSYQITRNMHAREIQTFTAALVQSVQEDAWFGSIAGQC
jgi:hypothetical protein